MTEQIANVSSDVDNAHTVEVFLSALQDEDFDTAAAQLDDDIVYQNVGFSNMRGRARVMKLMRGIEGRMGFEVKTHRIAVNGSSVLTERTDALVLGPVRIQIWACGIFEVRNGRITLWRDYIDLWDLLKATGRGLVGAVVPGLRPRL
ncbi:MAG: limonene-1,2-epoxide hydrolase [Mycobacterium sp.]|nr:MAG: limonene-1,2-epoxide hydrolase [Mycobacterium sp.]